MKFSVFAVYDRKANTYFTPMFGRGSAEIVRGFVQVCNDSKSTLNQYPDDFVLREIALFDDSTGVFSSADVAVDVIDARGAIAAYSQEVKKEDNKEEL